MSHTFKEMKTKRGHNIYHIDEVRNPFIVWIDAKAKKGERSCGYWGPVAWTECTEEAVGVHVSLLCCVCWLQTILVVYLTMVRCFVSAGPVI